MASMRISKSLRGWAIASAVALSAMAANAPVEAADPAPAAAKSPPNNFTADEQTPESMAKPTPAFPGQTNAPVRKSTTKFVVETVTTALSTPWSLAFLPDGKMLVTEFKGTMRIVTPEGVHSVVEGVPPVKTVAAQGLHDVVLDPNFGRNRLIYFSYFAPPPGEAPAAWPNVFAY